MESSLSNEDSLELQKIRNSNSSNVITDHQDLLTFSTYAEDHLNFSTCNPGSTVEPDKVNVKVDVESFVSLLKSLLRQLTPISSIIAATAFNNHYTSSVKILSKELQK